MAGTEKQPRLDPYVNSTKKTVTIQMSLEDAKRACLELVTKNGRPYCLMEDSGFQKFIRPIFSTFGTTMTRNKISEMVHEYYNFASKKLEDDLKGKLISVKMDSVTRLTRGFIGINIQFCQSGNFALRTLTVKELKESHTAEYIRKVVKECLKKFSISLDQIYSVTTDNGANFLKAVQLFQSDTDPTLGLPLEWEEVDPDLEIRESDWEPDWSDTNIQTTENAESYDDLHATFNTALINMSPVLKGLRCAAHSLQLAVHDFLKLKSPTKVIAASRKLVAKLRTPNLRYVLEGKQLKPPPPDVLTRWNSTFDMISSLLNLKDCCQELKTNGILKNVAITENAWKELEGLVKILEPAKIATVALQRESITGGEFYEQWSKMKLLVQNQGTVMSKKFLDYLNIREKPILTSEVFAAMFVDPRYKNLLTQQQSIVAIQEVIAVARRILQLRESNHSSSDLIVPENTHATSGVGEILSEPKDVDLEFEMMLSQADQARPSAPDTTNETNLNLLKQEIETYKKFPRVTDRHIDIFKWWWQRHDLSELFKESAAVILSVPVTQVSVERLFSGLHFILSDARGRLSQDSVDNLLFLRVNEKFE